MKPKQFHTNRVKLKTTQNNSSKKSRADKKANKLLGFYLRGIAMGAADVVPGVSGGTIAFITGIYERLLNAIRAIQPTLLRLVQKEGIAAAWHKIDGTFLISLFVGILTSLLSLANLIKWCLAEFPEMLWAFFMGLIIASAVFILKQIKDWGLINIFALVMGTGIALGISVLSPSQAPNSYPMVFFAGMIAICAMILPGISGSFILLLLGMYHHVLDAVSDRNILYLLVFATGCLLGLLLFSHVLSWTYKNHKGKTLSLLSGFLIGSLYKVWPWQNVLMERINSHGEKVPWLMKNVMPSNYQGNANLLYCTILVLGGFFMVFIFENLASQKDED